MAIDLSSNFQLFATLPLDSRFQVADITARDAIPSGQRYEGLTTYCVADQTVYRLVGGITNSDWLAFSATYYVPYATKATGTDAGTQGQLSIDDDYMYICVTGGGVGVAIWKKIALSQT